MSWWNAKYTNGNGDNEITFGSKYYERAKAVEKVCQAVIDKKVKTPDDVAVVVRCKDCKYRIYKDMGEEIGEIGGCALFNCAMTNDDFCSYGEKKDGGDA
jgi:hypothetical protein